MNQLNRAPIGLETHSDSFHTERNLGRSPFESRDPYRIFCQRWEHAGSQFLLAKPPGQSRRVTVKRFGRMHPPDVPRLTIGMSSSRLSCGIEAAKIRIEAGGHVALVEEIAD